MTCSSRTSGSSSTVTRRTPPPLPTRSVWERLGGLSAFVEEADQLVGLAQLIAEANGLARESHIREKSAR